MGINKSLTFSQLKNEPKEAYNEDKLDKWASLESTLRPAAERAEAMQELNKKLNELATAPARPLQIKISVYPEFNEVVLKRDDEYFSVMTNEIDGLIEQLTKAKQEIKEFGSDLAELEENLQ